MNLGGFFARGVRGAVVAAALAGAGSAGAATLNVNASGILLGASGVDVGGTLYDVQFLDGTCSALFNGCDAVSDFAFTTQADALAAAVALIDQVVVDGPAGNFRNRTDLVNGCTSPENCQVYVPYEILSSGRVTVLEATFSLGAPGVNLNNVGPNDNLSGSVLSTFAVFSLPSVTAVPVPAALPLLLGALGVLGLAGRRRRG